MPNLSSRRIAGFTLIELLVVLAVIAVLIASLIPSLSRARDSARSAGCMSNQRQIALITTSYLGDNKYFFPASYTNYVNASGATVNEYWYKKLGEGYLPVKPSSNVLYLGDGKGAERILYCAAAPRRDQSTIVTPASISYGWNFVALTFFDRTTVSTGYNGQTASFSRVENPSETVLTTDTLRKITDADQNQYVASPEWWGAGYIGFYMPNSRHFDKANYLMIDGHVQALTYDVGGYIDKPYWRMKKN